MSLDDLYREVILDHSRRPWHVGLREPFSAEVYQVNPTCGDEVTVRVALSADGTEVVDLSYQPQGCSISVASASVMARRVTGVAVADAIEAYEAFRAVVTTRPDGSSDVRAVALPDDDSAAFAGVARFPARVKCALLGWTAFREALLRAASDR